MPAFLFFFLFNQGQARTPGATLPTCYKNCAVFTYLCFCVCASGTFACIVISLCGGVGVSVRVCLCVCACACVRVRACVCVCVFFRQVKIILILSIFSETFVIP